jgi:uncharacterized protein YcbK (DUF882 family)
MPLRDLANISNFSTAFFRIPETGPRLRRRELLLAAGLCLLAGTARAAPLARTRRLRLKNAHTGESFDGPYRDQDGPIPGALEDLAALFRDFHVDEVGPVDVGAVDFLADVMAETGQSCATILSAYRTKETNEMLARTQFGVAENSEHIGGHALDVTFETKLPNAMRAARSLKRGGVGWYPASHFIHLDSGRVRNWDLDSAGLARLLAGSPKGPLLAASPEGQRLGRSGDLTPEGQEKARLAGMPALAESKHAEHGAHHTRRR